MGWNSSGRLWMPDDNSEYVCIEECVVGGNVISKGTVIDGIAYGDSFCSPAVLFNINNVNYVLPMLTFLHFFAIRSDAL